MNRTTTTESRSRRAGATAAGLLVAASLAGGVLATAAPASANDDDVIRRGGCTGSTDWKIKASPEDGRIEVESEIDSNRNGQAWSWKLFHNGDLTARGSSTTRAPSGSFEVRRVTTNLRGTDDFRFRAVHGSEVCVARVSF